LYVNWLNGSKTGRLAAAIALTGQHTIGRRGWGENLRWRTLFSTECENNHNRLSELFHAAAAVA
jgi:hypothetical protein